MIALLSYYSDKNFKIIIQSTLLVLLVKAAVSPQSPLPAYFSVSFQGFAGALIFSILPNFRVAAILFGIIALVESGMHMPIIKTVYYGMYFWEAIDLFFKNILKELSIKSTISFSFWLILIYLGVYALWGTILGIWIGNLPAKIGNSSANILRDFNALERKAEIIGIKKSKQRFKFLGIVFTLFFLLLVIYFTGGSQANAIYIVLRTIAILIFIFYVLSPFVRWLLKKASNKHSGKVKSILDEFPSLKNNLAPAYQLASIEHTGLKKYRYFVLILIVVSLYQPSLESKE
jgi:hypothetical protein